MSMKLLNVAPRFDEPTKISYEWNQSLLKELNKSNFTITNLLEEKAEPKLFKENLRNHDVVIFFDHGIEDALIGQHKSKLITIKEAGLLEGKRVFAMACLSAKELGVEAFHKGCEEYWGAIEPLGFTLEDAHLFGEVFIEGASKRFGENMPIEEVYKSMIEHFNTQISKTNNPWSKIWLQKNSEIWVVWYENNKPVQLAPKGLWARFIRWFKGLLKLDIRDTGLQLI